MTVQFVSNSYWQPQEPIIGEDGRARYPFMRFLNGIIDQIGGQGGDDVALAKAGATTNSTDITNLTNAQAATNADVSTIDGRVTTLEATVISLQSQIDAANLLITALTTKVDNLITLTGVAANSVDLGTMAGTLTDNQTIKAAIDEGHP